MPTQCSLLQCLREELHLNGPKLGCGEGDCGACTVLVDGVPRYSCSVLTHTVRNAKITTIEGLAAADGTLHPIQQAFHENHGLQCGYCTPGMVMAALPLLERARAGEVPTDDEIRTQISGNLCRCTGYANIVRAIASAARRVRDEGQTDTSATASG